jgi:tRNA (adenine37-N6)-methyltransferase
MPRPLQIEPIGVIDTPFEEATGTPIQSARAGGARGTIRLDPRFRARLQDLEGFERIWVIYWFHEAPAPRLMLTPFLDKEERGVFATRAPARPSPIGMYEPEFDCYPGSRAGWLDQSRLERSVADDRFGVAPPAGTKAEP